MKKATKKTAAKPQVKKATKASSKKATPTTAKNIRVKIDKEKFKSFSKSAIKVLGLLLILLLVDLFVQYLNNDYSVAIVNGQRIPRREYIRNLETFYGLQVAENMIQEELIRQLGKKKGVEINTEDVDEAYNKIEEQIGGSEALQAALETNNMTEEQLREQLRNELILKAIIEPTLEYTEEDLANFFEEYKDFLFEDTSNITFESERDAIEGYYIEQKTFEARDTILNDFRQEVTIQINVPGANEEETSYGFFKATRNLISNFIDERNTN